MKYKLPEKNLDRVIDIEGFDPYELPKVSFAEKMNFVTWLDKMKKQNPEEILKKIITDALPQDLANAILETGNIPFISEIYVQIVSVKLGMTTEEYLKQSEKQL